MLIAAAAVVAATYFTGHWLGGLAIVVLLAIWRLLHLRGAPPVLAMALTFQWTQVTLGLFYVGATGEYLQALSSSWERMVLIGLGCVVSLLVSVYAGIRLVRHMMPEEPPPTAPVFSDRTLYLLYGASVVFTGAVQEVAWQFPALTQMILALNYSHLALVFLIARRSMSPVFDWRKVGGLMALEIALGFTGYFAAFREPLIIGMIALFEVFDTRSVRHWSMAVGVVFILGFSSLLWMSVRDQYRTDFDAELFEASRADRLARMQTLSSGFLDLDASEYRDTFYNLVDRMWVIYYPALALDRVPSVLPHTNGAILAAALRNLVTPRILFPDKPVLPSDSEMVRQYSGIPVAGAERGTSIAFGYAGEAYVDFGLPWMFIPVLIWGFVLGVAYQLFLRIIYNRELAVALVTVVFWLSLYLFERSWVKTIGLSVSLMVYLGGLTFLVDRFLLMRQAELAEAGILPDSSLDHPITR